MLPQHSHGSLVCAERFLLLTIQPFGVISGKLPTASGLAVGNFCALTASFGTFNDEDCWSLVSGACTGIRMSGRQQNSNRQDDFVGSSERPMPIGPHNIVRPLEFRAAKVRGARVLRRALIDPALQTGRRSLKDLLAARNKSMARKKSPDKTTDIAPVSEQKTDVSLVPDENTATFYVNCAEIANNQHEFAIMATRLPTKPPPEYLEQYKDTGQIVISPDVQLVIPTTLIQALIQVLTSQKESYERLFGPIAEPKFQGVVK